MKLSYRMWTLPLIAGLAMASAFACSNGTESADDENGGTGSTSEGGSTSTDTSPSEGGTTADSTDASTSTTPDSGATWSAEFADDEEGFTAFYSAYGTDDTEVYTTTSAVWANAPGYGSTSTVEVNGYLEVSIPDFLTTQDTYQQVAVGLESLATPLDLTGKTISCRVKLVSGLTANDESMPSGATLMVKTGEAWVYASGAYTNLEAGVWKEVTFDADNPDFADTAAAEPYDVTWIRQVAINISTSGEATAIEVPGVVQIDHCWY